MPYWMQFFPGRYGPIPRSTQDEVKTNRHAAVDIDAHIFRRGMVWNGMVEKAKWIWSSGEPTQEPALDAWNIPP